MNSRFSNLSARLRTVSPPLPTVAIGFDGFVDEMITLVEKRDSLSTFSAVPSISAFGDLVSRSAGHSSLREIMVNAIHPGGCAVNMGDGLAALGIHVDAFATLGQPVHPAFSEILGRFKSHRTWGREPGRTLAFEFSDGKLMFSSVSHLAEFTASHVQAMLADGAYAAACAGARVIALTNWTLYPHMTSVWRLLHEKVYSKLRHRPSFFVDLVDPSTRSAEDIREMLATLSVLESNGSLTLGVNRNEANILARLFSLSETTDDITATQNLAQALRDRMGISEVVIHHIRSAAVAGTSETSAILAPYCEKPKKSTGAGDRFNAGYCLGVLLQLKAEERLACACACAGFFVRNAHSPYLNELAEFLDSCEWPNP